MNCSEIESLLPAYLDRLLPPEEKNRIEAHVAACPRCGRALAELQRTADFLRDLEAVEPPPFFEQKIMARVREESGRKRGILQWLFHPVHVKVPIQAAAMIFIAVSAIYVYQKGEPEMRKAAPLPAPITGSEKVGTTDETVKAPANASGAAPAGQASSPRPPEQIRERSPAPPVAKGGKEEGPPEFSSPLRKDRPPAPLPARRDGEAEMGALRQARREMPGISRDKADRLEAVRESAEIPPEQKLSRMKAGAGTAAGEAAKSASPPAPLRSAVETYLDLTLRVGNASAAARDIEASLDRFSARIVESRHRGDRGYLKVEIAARHVPAFLERLEGIGRVDAEKSRPAGQDGKATVRINIVGNP
jgi:hypothetical protein